jgi:hypothetical protein
MQNVKAAVRVIGHPSSDGLFLAFQHYQVREDPFAENSPGPRFYIRPFNPPALSRRVRWFGFQLEQGQQKPFPLARGKGLDLSK